MHTLKKLQNYSELDVFEATKNEKKIWVGMGWWEVLLYKDNKGVLSAGKHLPFT